ncbi:MAG: hypothetical protein IT349_15290 [Candidatus Eisenbacteria bacterium]|nr:hypothetical protein [Candidatus Eisenbacteria bacterium]MCC7143461.1 hypothetical protein [Candidatus Eisenbacteria bacterium]
MSKPLLPAPPVLLTFLTALLILLGAGHLLPQSIGEVRFWALDAPRYLSIGWTAAAAVAATLLFLRLQPKPGAVGTAEGGTTASLSPGRGATLLWLTLPLVLFVVLRSEYAFLGDNFLRVHEAERGLSSPNEVGIMAIFHLGTRIARSHDWGDARGVITLVSWIAGALFVAVTLAFARRSAQPGLVFSGLLAGGASLLFCGYVEVYPLVLAVGAASVHFAWRAARGDSPPWIAILLSAAAIALHRIAIVWAPVAVLPILLAPGTTVPRRALWLALVLPWILGITAVVATPLGGGLLLPLFGGNNPHYQLLSAARLSDFLNAQWIGSFAGALLAPVALLQVLRAPSIDRPTLVLGAAWYLPFVVLFFFRPTLGGADWDVLALASPFAALFALTVLPPAVPRAVVALSLALALPWIAAQHGDPAVARVRDLIRTDRGDYYRTHPPEMHLAMLFGSNRRFAEQEEELKAGAARFPKDPRYPYNLSALYRLQARWDLAETFATRSWQMERAYLPPVDVLYDVFRETGRREDQLLAGLALLEAYDSQREAVTKYLSERRIEQIRSEVEALRHLLPPETGPH